MSFCYVFLLCVWCMCAFDLMHADLQLLVCRMPYYLPPPCAGAAAAAVAAAAAGHHSRATFKSGGSSAASSLATSRSEHFQNPRRPALPSKARVSQGGGAPSLLKSGVISAASGSGGALSAPTEQVVAELVSQLAASLSLRAKDRENSQRERERERAHFDSAASQLLDRLEEAQAQLALAGRSMSG
mmetsp:Transcript_45644/g.105344  ORF Transcript_45644/g.105344 Transcript_45644/m.105344 type:complete len:186 (+) Transcript_45644:407-964(+)